VHETINYCIIDMSGLLSKVFFSCRANCPRHASQLATMRTFYLCACIAIGEQTLLSNFSCVCDHKFRRSFKSKRKFSSLFRWGFDYISFGFDFCLLLKTFIFRSSSLFSHACRMSLSFNIVALLNIISLANISNVFPFSNSSNYKWTCIAHD
jgi:hypothetical protein